MGTYETAISSIVATVFILLLFAGLNISREKRDRREMVLGLYGLFAGMVISFIWLGRLHVTLANAQNIVAACAVIVIADMCVCLRFTKPRPSAPCWAHITLWAVAANALPPIVLCYLALYTRLSL